MDEVRGVMSLDFAGCTGNAQRHDLNEGGICWCSLASGAEMHGFYEQCLSKH